MNLSENLSDKKKVEQANSQDLEKNLCLKRESLKMQKKI